MMRALPTILAGALALSLLGGCAGDQQTDQKTPAPSAASQGAYPRTVTLDGSSVTLPRRAERVVALSPDVADVAMALNGADRLVAVPELSVRPEQSVNAATAKKVPHTIATTGTIDPEKVLALNPDLVLLTSRHGAEQDALKQLTQAGVPVLSVSNKWDSPDVYRRNVTAIASALGVEQRATKHLADYDARYQKVVKATSSVAKRPRVATLRILGPNTWINGPGTIGYRVVKDAGATNVGDELKLKRSTKLDKEQLVRTNPDWLVVVDSRNKGRKQYDSILNDPGLASVEAVKKDQICVITSGDMASGTGGITALEKVARCLHPTAVK